MAGIRKSKALKTLARQEKEARQKRKLGNLVEIKQLEANIEKLKVYYEHFFIGKLAIKPYQEHEKLKKEIQEVRKLPFQTSEETFKIRALEQRYQTLNSYWERTTKDKELGIYKKDIFKEELRRQQSGMSVVKESFKNVIKNMQKVLTTSISIGDINPKKFENLIKEKTKEFQKKTGIRNVQFEIVKKDGKIGIMVKPAKEDVKPS